MKSSFPKILLCLLLMSACLLAVTDELPPQEFLKVVRQPLQQDSWMELTAKAVSKRENSELLEGDMHIRMTFSPQFVLAQVTLNDKNVYGFVQRRNDDGTINAEIDRPENEATPSIFDFGITPSDVSFAFIYWDFMEELPRQKSRWRECRLMKLADPTGNGYVIAWFNAQHGFPMEAQWYHNGEDEPWRSLIMKGAKRHGNGLWFVREMNLFGKDWKTVVRFDFVDLNKIGE